MNWFKLWQYCLLIRKNTLIFLLALVVMVFTMAHSIVAHSAVVSPNIISLKEFIELATSNDPTFESLLIQNLPLQYRRTLLMPDRDIMMDVKFEQYFFLDQNKNDQAASISLSKLFPEQGAEVSLAYRKQASVTSAEDSSLQLLISLPIAKNAFGKSNRLLDQIIGIENDISRYQIIEAYEDYLASLTAAYYNWFSAYENLRLSKLSYQSNQKLMDDMLDRQKQKIARDVDVNKMKLLLLEKQENVIILQEVFDNYANLIYKATHISIDQAIVPEKPNSPINNVDFDKDYHEFVSNSRTYKALRALEDQGTLEVKRNADDLLPSTNLLLGYQVEGEDWEVRRRDDEFMAGISLQWPIGRRINKAKKAVVEIEYKKTVLSNQNKYEELRLNLKNIYLQILKEKNLIDTASKKTKLAQSILKDEAENYSFGKVTLNDYIVAVNRVDISLFNETEHQVTLNKLLIEWLRLTDRLVDKRILD